MASPVHTPEPPAPIDRMEEDRLDRIENIGHTPAALWVRDAAIIGACLIPVAGVYAFATLLRGSFCCLTN
jgi:hypothetical protein